MKNSISSYLDPRQSTEGHCLTYCWPPCLLPYYKKNLQNNNTFLGGAGWRWKIAPGHWGFYSYLWHTPIINPSHRSTTFIKAGLFMPDTTEPGLISDRRGLTLLKRCHNHVNPGACTLEECAQMVLCYKKGKMENQTHISELYKHLWWICPLFNIYIINCIYYAGVSANW